MATFYYHKDPGSPAVEFTTTQANSSTIPFGAVKTVIKACLVEGYGTKAAAGWTLVDEGELFIVLRNGSQSGYLCLQRYGNGFRVYVAETFTGMNGSVMTGAGLKTGSDVNNSLPHYVPCNYFVYRPEFFSWCIVADSKTFSFFGTNGTGYQRFSGTTSVSSGFLNFTCGESSDGSFLCLGNLKGTGQSYGGIGPNHGFTLLKNPMTGELIDSSAVELRMPPFSPSPNLDHYHYASEIQLERVPWGINNNMVGYLRGRGVIAELFMQQSLNTMSISLGRSEGTDSYNLCTPLDIGDGYNYVITQARYNTPSSIITDNPVLWQ